MSIGVIISNPVNDREREFYLPVSAKKAFQEYWMPVIEELDLKWAKCFPCGIEIGLDDLPPILQDISVLRSWIAMHMLNDEERVHITGRLDSLCDELIKVFTQTRSDIKIYIG